MYAVKPEGSRTALQSSKMDADLFRAVGTYPLICAQEIAELTGRDITKLRERLSQFTSAGYLGRAHGAKEVLSFFEEIRCPSCKDVFKHSRESGRSWAGPWFYWLRPRQEIKHYGYSWHDRSVITLDHDRGITLIHLAIRNLISRWAQDRSAAMKVKVGSKFFYPDAVFQIGDTTYYLEYQHSRTRSTNGENGLDTKMRHYNALLKNERDSKVIFVFREPEETTAFLNRVADEYPYRWCWATDIEIMKHNPTGKIFLCPKDFDTVVRSFEEA